VSLLVYLLFFRNDQVKSFDLVSAFNEKKVSVILLKNENSDDNFSAEKFDYQIIGENLGENISVYKYKDIATLQQDKKNIFSNGSLRLEDGEIEEWSTTAHFFTKDNMIVFYLGDNRYMYNLLESIFNPQFAGGVIPNFIKENQEVVNISWDRALEMVYGVQVIEVAQSHNLDVFLTTQDGKVFKTKETETDLIFQEIKKCGEKCLSINITTE
jgi:hypothetical protein